MTGREPIDLSLGNPSAPAPTRVNEALTELLNTDDTVHAYTSAEGDPRIRAAIAEHIQRTYGHPALSERIIITTGAAAGLAAIYKALLSEGDEMLAPVPCFPEYRVFTENAGGKFVEAPCLPDFELDIDGIRSRITEGTAVVTVNSPNNPTGAVYSRASLEALAELLYEKSQEYSHPIYLLADEPYREISYGYEVPYIPNIYKNTVVCYSFSKSLSLPGERIGYVHIGSECENGDAVTRATAGALRALGYVCAPSMMQRLLPECLGLSSDIGEYRRNRDALVSALTEYGYELNKPKGAFYLFMRSPTPDAREFSDEARREGLLIVPSDSFGAGGYLRIAYCVSPETVSGALPIFKMLAKRHGLTKKD